MFQAAHRSSSGAVFAASVLYSHVVTSRCPGWVGTQFPAIHGVYIASSCVDSIVSLS